MLCSYSLNMYEYNRHFGGDDDEVRKSLRKLLTLRYHCASMVLIYGIHIAASF